MIPFLLVLPLLVTLAQGNMPISGCSVPNSCFGLPANCQPDTNCHVYFQFDQEGNLDVNVKDVTDEDAYIALAVDIQPGLSVDYLICLPRQERRISASSVNGQPILISDQIMADYVQVDFNNHFICTFLAIELPPNFRQKSLFFVTEGIFATTGRIIIPPGRQLSPINSDFRNMHNISATSKYNKDEMALTPEENKMTSDLVKKVQRISESASKDIDLEDILNGSGGEEEQEDDLEDMLDSRTNSTRKKDLQKKKKVARDDDEEDEEEDRKPRRRNGRPSRYQEDDDDEDEDEDDEDYVPKKKSRRPSSRRFDSDEEDDDDYEEEDNHEGKSRKNKNHNKKKGKKSDDDDYEEEDEERQDDDHLDDERSSESTYPYTIPVIIVTLVYCFLIRN